MVNVIGYVRRSTDRQEESLEQQRAKLEAFAQKQGWKLERVYTDDAISGSDMDRPGLLKLLHHAKTCDDVHGVIAWDRNRLARPKDALDGLQLERQILNAGKRIIYAATGLEADSSFTSGLMGYIEHHQNGDYLRKLSRDTARGVVARVKRGFWPGGPIPFGFDRLIVGDDLKPKRIVRDLDDGQQAIISIETGDILEMLPKGKQHKKQDYERCTLVPSLPSRVRAVQRIFADIAAGKPVRVIRDWLNDSGFRTSYGNKFTSATLLPLLTNQVYIGHCVYNRRTLSKWHTLIDEQSVPRKHNDESIEMRPECDWIVFENAWDALVDVEIFGNVQLRRKSSRDKHQTATGTSTRAGYLLTGLVFCGVCGGRLQGMTTTSGKGYKTRYHLCSTHHNGDHERCSKRYTVPAKMVEDHIIDLIKTDLLKLRDDDKLHEYVANELQRVSGGNTDARDQLQSRVADLDQKLAKLRDHLTTIDPQTAIDLGLYDQAKQVGQERREVAAQLERVDTTVPDLPDMNTLRQRASAAFDRLNEVLDSGSLEEKRYLIGAYVQKIVADPHTCSVQISLYPALFSSIIGATGFEPATS